MATNTKQARKQAEIKRAKYYNNYISMWCNLFNNSVKVENLGSLPKRYLLRVLRNKGGIAYDKETGLYLPYNETGVDAYGLPTGYYLVGYNGLVLFREPKDVVILRANDLAYPIFKYFEQQAYKVVDYDMAIEQNLDSIKTMTICEVPDQATMLSMANEYESRRLGATVIFKNKQSADGSNMKTEPTGATYLVDNLLQARKEVLNETLSTIGISVANTDKKERVQGVEIMASKGYALDYLNTLVETFNHDAKIGGLNIRLVANTSLMEQYKKEMSEENEDGL